MKKNFILIAFFSVCLCVYFTGCKNVTEQVTKTVYMTPIWKGSLAAAPENPETGWAYYNTAEKKSYIYDGQTWQIFAQDGIDGKNGADGKNGTNGKDGKDLTIDENNVKEPEIGWIYIGEDTEEIEGISYSVKSYANLYAENAYFYDYYKFYYLEEKIRRVYEYIRKPGCNMDYDYLHFQESNDSFTNFLEGMDLSVKKTIYTYYENGLLDTKILYDPLDLTIEWFKQTFSYSFYDDGKIKSKIQCDYDCQDEEGNLDAILEYYYYPNGNLGLYYYNYEGEAVKMKFYYESGYVKNYKPSYSSSYYTFADDQVTDDILEDSEEPAEFISKEILDSEQVETKHQELKSLFD